MITGGDEVCILPPPNLSEKGVDIPPFVHYPSFFRIHKEISIVVYIVYCKLCSSIFMPAAAV